MSFYRGDSLIIALLGESYLKGYKGIYRKFPCAPKGKKALTLWSECLCLIQGKLLANASSADLIAEYMNMHMDDFEQEGKYRRILN